MKLSYADGLVTDENGEHWDAEDFVAHKLGICCASDNAKNLLLGLLHVTSLNLSLEERVDAIDKFVKPFLGADAIFELGYSLLENQSLISHSGNISSSNFIEEAGQDLLELIEQMKREVTLEA